MKKTLLIVLSLTFLMACSTKTRTVLIGKFAPDAVDSVMVTVDELGIDTILNIQNGRIRIELPSNKAVASMIGSKKYYPEFFVLDGTTVTFDFTSEPTVLIAEPKSINKSLSELNVRAKEIDAKYTREIMTIQADSTLEDSAKQASMEAKQDEIMDEYAALYKDIFRGNKDNYLGVYAMSMLQSILGPSESKEMLNMLEKKVKETGIVRQMQEQFEKSESTAEGAMFTDFTVEQGPGNSIKLSDYVGKGKYVLVDFWASWCGPCRREIPNIKKVYDKYKGEKFEVLSVAVWDKPEDTMKALKEEGLKWPQIINAQRIPTDIYAINGIPHIILFGPDGTILKRGLRGENIESEVAKYVK